MAWLSNFLLAFAFSFLGSIPPGTISLTVIQLGLEQRFHLALRFAFAATIIEYPYAWIAVTFEKLITSSAGITEHLHLIASAVMIVVGVVNLWPRSENPTPLRIRFANSGYRRGILVGMLNPLAIPYWLAITAYLRSANWVDLKSTGPLHAYLLGVFGGAFLLMIILAQLSRKVMVFFSRNPSIKKLPGMLLLILGIYSFLQYLLLR